MTQHKKPKLIQPKDEVIRKALHEGAWNKAESLLRSLYLGNAARSKGSVVRKDIQQCLQDAQAAATDLHDFVSMLGTGYTADLYVDRTVKMSECYAPFRDMALAMVAATGI